MNAQHPYWEVELFLRVIELGSIRAAAREANLEPSSVSRKLSALEHRLKSKLLDRTQARSQATDAGLRYYQKMRLLLPQLEAAEADIAGEALIPKGLLKVNASIDFGQHFVADWLYRFKRQHPKVEVQLTLASHQVDLVSEGVDLAIRVGELKDSSLKARKLADVPRVLVASHAYLDQRGMPTTPLELEEHEHVFFSPSSRQQPLLLKGPDGKTYRVQRKGSVSVNAVHSVVKAVELGFGIHAGPRWAFQASIDRGQVKELLPDFRQASMPMNAIWTPAVLMPARVRAFVEFAAEQVRTIKGLQVS